MGGRGRAGGGGGGAGGLPSWRRLRDLFLDMHEADGCHNCLGPDKGCFLGCLGFWLGKGCRAVYWAKDAKKATLEVHKGSDDGLLDLLHIKIDA